MPSRLMPAIFYSNRLSCIALGTCVYLGGVGCVLIDLGALVDPGLMDGRSARGVCAVKCWTCPFVVSAPSEDRSG